MVTRTEVIVMNNLTVEVWNMEQAGWCVRSITPLSWYKSGQHSTVDTLCVTYERACNE